MALPSEKPKPQAKVEGSCFCKNLINHIIIWENNNFCLILFAFVMAVVEQHKIARMNYCFLFLFPFGIVGNKKIYG
jgi:hypothetical protein